MKIKLFPAIGSFSLAATLLLSGCGSAAAAKPKKTHDPETLIVTGTENELLGHFFVDGKCKYCNETTIFMQDPIGKTDIPKKTYEHRGRVEEIHYKTRSYYTENLYPDSGELWLEKTAYVFLPYGYDENDTQTKYNVFYLLHGSKLNEGYWFARGSYSPTDSAYTMGYGTENVLDYLYENNLAEKTIIVTPSLYSPIEGYDVDGDEWEINVTFGRELINELMPYVAEHYNTYAASGSQEDLKAARDHHAYAGLSKGSGTSYVSIWAYCLEYISYIGTYSNFTMTDERIQAIVDGYKADYSDCKVNYWYCTAGSSELNMDPHADGVPVYQYYNDVREAAGLKSGCDIQNGDGAEYMLVNGTAHNYATWLTALYNCMLVFFKA